MRLPGLLCILLTITFLDANAASGLKSSEEQSAFDKAWSYLTLYDNPDNPAIQMLSFVGRAQLDSAWVTPNDQENWNDVSWRRFRAGIKMSFLHSMVAHLEADFNLNEDSDEWYDSLTDAYFGWSPSIDLNIKLLKQSAGFTLDGATSSKKLLTMERNNLTNNLWFTSEYFNGALVSGKFQKNWNYKAGFFSSDGDPELGWDDASWFTLWSFGYSLGKSDLRVDYVYQDEDPNANTRDFEQVLSTNIHWQEGPWGLRGDLAFGKGFADLGQEDVWGGYIMPYYDFNKFVQVVMAYTYVDGDGENSVRLNRYEGRAVEGRGDRYKEIYSGLNIYFYKHKFKWQTGLSYAVMDDSANDGGEYQGWTLNTGLRISW